MDGEFGSKPGEVVVNLFRLRARSLLMFPPFGVMGAIALPESIRLVQRIFRAENFKYRCVESTAEVMSRRESDGNASLT